MNDPLCHDILPSIPALFTSQVVRDPSAVAVVDEHEQLTYAELDRCSARLALLLKERGAGPAKLVAVRMERSVDLLIALLADGERSRELDEELDEERIFDLGTISVSGSTRHVRYFYDED